MASKKKTSKKAAKVNKSEWIRNQSPNLSAAELVTRAGDRGITITVGQVYTARSAARKAEKNGHTRPTKTKGGNDLDQDFRRIVLSIGINQAESMMSELRAEAGL